MEKTSELYEFLNCLGGQANEQTDHLMVNDQLRAPILPTLEKLQAF